MFIFVSKYWPVSAELMAQYKDGSHTYAFNGNLFWQNQNVQRHRDGDKPAAIRADGTLWWMQHDVWHRSCGPAAIYLNGKLEWRINNKNITQEVNEWLNGEEWRGTPEQIFEFQLRFT